MTVKSIQILKQGQGWTVRLDDRALMRNRTEAGALHGAARLARAARAVGQRVVVLKDAGQAVWRDLPSDFDRAA